MYIFMTNSQYVSMSLSVLKIRENLEFISISNIDFSSVTNWLQNLSLESLITSVTFTNRQS